MELALGAMAGLAPKLGELLMAEYVVQKGLKPDVESLSRELVMMNAALVDASRVPPEQLSEVEKLWARQVRELSYNMEDAVDDFILRVADGGNSAAAAATDANVFKKILGKATATMKKFKDRRQISDKVKDIKKLSNELAELRAKYTVRGAGADLAVSMGIDPRVLNLYKKESDLVGIEESRDKVIRMLRIKDDGDASDQSPKIVSIVGVGGLGKTTLAKTVHDMLKKQFSACAFISIGRTPNLARIFEKMLVELDQKYGQLDMSRWDAEQFSNELNKFLEHKRYFIVVDDIWDVLSWETIRHALKDNNCRSRIIMTTRNFEVATKAGEVYRLKPLSDENSKKLFYKRIQNQEGESLDGVSIELSSKMIHKCGGVPLAIIAIASLLVERPYEDWSKVYDSIGCGNGDNTTKILSYSYFDLPSYLKPCLLHLSKFPEDYILETKSVIWMWIGEGFIHLEKEKGNLFEVGERYFNELVNRSMIQTMRDYQFTQYFCVHDIVFDLIRKLSSVENFITILESREQHASPDSLRRGKKTIMPHLGSKVRRLSVLNCHLHHIPEDIMDMTEVLRSLSIINSKFEIMDPLHSFRVCRVISIEHSYVPIILKHLGSLLHLKYLEIYDTHVDDLPKEIGHLKSLNALVLIEIGLDQLPPAVCSLTQLMCLVAKGFKRFPTDRMGNLTSLEELQLKTIVGQSAMEDLVVELGKLTRLRMVRIIFSEELYESLQKALVQSLCILQGLQELELSSNTGSSQQGAAVWEDWKAPRQLRRLLIVGINFSRLPRWINHSRLPLLCYLSLKVYVVEVQDLDNLVRLPQLSYLELVGSIWPPWYTVGTEGFRNLRFCCVDTALKCHMSAMPRLEELQFGVYAGYWSWEKNGVPLEQFPTKDVIEDLGLGLDNLLSLEKVTFRVNCTGATAAEVQELEAMVTRAVENHPNRPTIKMDRVCEGNILSDERRVALLQQHIGWHLNVLEWKDKPDACFISKLRLYRRLEKVVISIDCAGANMCEVEKLEAALRHAAEVHPNHPTIQMIRRNTDEMVSSSYNPDTKLMCLIAEGFRRFPTDKMGNLISLEELQLKSVVGRSATEDLVVELGKQTRLRVVTITFSEELEESLQKALVQSLCNLQELQELKLSFTGLSQQGATVWEEHWEAPRQLQRLVIVGITFSRLPGWINRSRLPLLCFLSLSVHVVEVLDLDNLGRFPELSYLELVGYSWPPGYTVGTDGFRNLRFCRVGTTLKFHMSAMPRLEKLQFVVFAGYWSWQVNGVLFEQFPTKDLIEDLDLGLDNLLSLEKVILKIDCSGGTAAEVQEVEVVVTRSVENHPNCPTIQMDRTYEEHLLSDDEREDLLQHHIELHCRVVQLKDKPDAFFIAHLRLYRLLQKAVISIDCAGASLCEVEKVEEAHRHAAELHCNHPTIQLIRTNSDEMVSSSYNPDTKLMCLIAEGFRRFPTDKMGNLISLEELQLKSVVGRSATEDLVVELGKQTRLRVVTITFSEELEESLQKALVQSLCNLQELQELKLSFTGLSQQGATVWEEHWEAPRQLQRLVIVGITFSRLPGWINRSRLPLLCFLSLSVHVVEVLDLDNLGRFPELSYLELVGYSWPPGYTVGTDGFRNLRFCRVGTTLKFHMSAMPRLEKLQFVVFAGYWSWQVNGVLFEQFPTKDLIEDLDLGLDNLLSLEKVILKIDCSGGTAAEVQEVEVVVTRSVENHPNCPTIQMDRTYEEHLLSDDEREDLLQQYIEEHFGVLEWKDEPDAEFIIDLQSYRHLRKAVLSVDCAGARMCEVEKVEAALRHAAEVHRNHPTIQLIRTNTNEMVSSSDHPDTELDNHDDSPDNFLRKLPA